MPVKRSTKKVRLAGESIGSLDEFYDQLSRGLPLPAYFGRNLDALWDVLTVDLEGPLEMVWEDSAASARSLGKDFARISALLRAVEKERGDFRISFR